MALFRKSDGLLRHLCRRAAEVSVPPTTCAALTERALSVLLSVKRKVGLFLNRPYKYVLKCFQLQNTLSSLSRQQSEYYSFATLLHLLRDCITEEAGFFKNGIFYMLTNNTNL